MIDHRKELAILSTLGHIALAWALWVGLGTTPTTNTLQRMEPWVPNWFWPALFAANGLFALVGYFDHRALRASFRIGSAIMFLAAFGALISWTFADTPTGGTAAWLLYLGRVKWLIASQWLKEERRDAAVEKLAQQLDGGPT